MEFSTFLIISAVVFVVSSLLLLEFIRDKVSTVGWVALLSLGAAALAYVLPNLV